jgi:hypothetical protein
MTAHWAALKRSHAQHELRFFFVPTMPVQDSFDRCSP